MTIIARRMTILALIMTAFALSFSALVTHHGKGTGRLNAQTGCIPSYGCSVSL